jgi:hypothetical protein
MPRKVDFEPDSDFEQGDEPWKPVHGEKRKGWDRLRDRQVRGYGYCLGTVENAVSRFNTMHSYFLTNMSNYVPLQTLVTFDMVLKFFHFIVKLEYRSVFQFLSSVITDLIDRDLLVQQAYGTIKLKNLYRGIQVYAKRHLPEKAPPIMVEAVSKVYKTLTEREKFIFILWGNLALRGDSIRAMESYHMKKVTKQNFQVQKRRVAPQNLKEEDIVCTVVKDKIVRHEDRKIVIGCSCLLHGHVAAKLIKDIKLGGMLEKNNELCLLHGKFAIKVVDDEVQFEKVKKREIENLCTKLGLKTHSSRRNTAILVRLCYERNINFAKARVLTRFGWTSHRMLVDYCTLSAVADASDLVPFVGGLRAMEAEEEEEAMSINFKDTFDDDDDAKLLENDDLHKVVTAGIDEEMNPKRFKSGWGGSDE